MTCNVSSGGTLLNESADLLVVIPTTSPVLSNPTPDTVLVAEFYRAL